MNFAKALDYLNLGERVSRTGWLDIDTFIYKVNGTEVNIENLRNEAAKHLDSDNILNRGKTINVKPHIDMVRSDKAINVGWTPTREDMFADDWFIR